MAVTVAVMPAFIVGVLSILRNDFITYHHLVNILSLEGWLKALKNVGFEIVEYKPIVSEKVGRLFLQLDILWHAKTGTGEFGSQLHQYFQNLPNFNTAFGEVLRGALQEESTPSKFGGAVILAKKPKNWINRWSFK